MDIKWSKQRGIIKELLETFLIHNNMNFSYDTVAWLLCIKRGKPEGWFGSRCKRPNGNELQAIGELLEISAEWLLFGVGDIYKKTETEQKGNYIDNIKNDNSSLNEISSNLIKLLYKVNNLDKKACAS